MSRKESNTAALKRIFGDKTPDPAPDVSVKDAPEMVYSEEKDIIRSILKYHFNEPIACNFDVQYQKDRKLHVVSLHYQPWARSVGKAETLEEAVKGALGNLVNEIQGERDKLNAIKDRIPRGYRKSFS